MARKKKKLPPARPYRITIRLSEPEYEMVKEYSKAANTSMASYGRMAMLGKVPAIHSEITYDCTEMLKVFRNLSNYTGNLNQVTKKLNQGEPLDDEKWETIVSCINAILEMRDDLKKEAGSYRGNS